MHRQSPLENNPHILPGPHSRSKFPNVEIEILQGQARQLIRKFSDRVFLIGTDADCDMVLGDPVFPEVYAYFFLTKQGVSLRHLGLGPMFTINGRLLQSTTVFDGDLVKMARYEFLIHINWDLNPDHKMQHHDSTKPAPSEDQSPQDQFEALLHDVHEVVHSPDTPASSNPTCLSISQSPPLSSDPKSA